MSTGISVSPKRSPRSMVARSPRNTRASYRPSSKTSTCRTRLSCRYGVLRGIPLATDGIRRSHYGHGFLKQYVRDDRLLRTEPATNSVYDYGVNKDIGNLPQLREKTSAII